MKKNINQLKAGIILNYINLICGNLIPIFYTPVMLNLLGQEEYGLYKLSSSVTSYLSLLSLGIGSAVTRYLIKARTEKGQDEEERILGLFTIIFQIISVITLIIGIIVALNLDLFYSQSLTTNELSRMKVLVLLMVGNTVVTFLSTPCTALVSAHEKFIFLQITNIISTCVLPLLNIVVLYMGYASIGMAVSSLAIGIIIRFAFYIYVRNYMKIKARFSKLPLSLLKEILIFSFWIFVSNIVSQLYNSTDTVLIGAIPALATTGVAVYNIGATFNSIVFSATTGISSLLSPRANKMIFSGATKEEITDICIKVGRIQCYIISLLVSGFIVYGQPFIEFYVGSGYEKAYWVAILMMVPNMIPLVQSMCLSIIVAQNKHRFRAIMYLCIAIFNVIGTWLCLNKFGIIGAALMTAIGLILGQGFAMNWYYNKKTGINIIRFWKEVGKIYIIPVVLCVINLVINNYVDFYRLSNMIIGIVIYTFIFCLLNWTLIMNDYEKDLIRKPLSKILNKIKH